VVSPGTFSGLQVLLPGESVLGGTAAGKSGSPTGQRAGIPFNLTVRAVDQFWNLVNSVTDRVALGSSDAFALMPAETTLVGGQLTFPISLARSGAQRIWASDADQPAIQPDTSSAVQITGGTFAKLVLLAPGEYSAPGTAEGRAGTATAQSITYAFTVTVLATDAWFNPVTGISDAVHLSSNDLGAYLQADTTLTDGRTTMTVRLSSGGFQQITASDVTSPSKSASTTQVNGISTGFHRARRSAFWAGSGPAHSISIAGKHRMRIIVPSIVPHRR